MELTASVRNRLIEFQRTEITEHLFYQYLQKKEKGSNKKVLKEIAAQELRHYNIFKKYTGKDAAPDRFKLMKYLFLSKIFGLVFTVKLMELEEQSVQSNYAKLIEVIPEIKRIIDEENEHEKKLIFILHEEKLHYIGSVVLGLNDALVELTGALAGLSFALQNTKLVGIAGIITGIAASLSMGASEYLSQKAENQPRPLKAALYTGFTYIFTVLLLVAPFFLYHDYRIDLAISLMIAISIIFTFSYFVSVTQEVNFKHRFFEMASLSLGVALISFLIGIALRGWLGIEA